VVEEALKFRLLGSERLCTRGRRGRSIRLSRNEWKLLEVLLRGGNRLLHEGFLRGSGLRL
jgi:DNA-binding response OmpR family regulator